MWYFIALGIALILIIIMVTFATFVYIDYKKAASIEEENERYNEEYKDYKKELMLRQYYRDLKFDHNLDQDNYKIIGIREPIGKWTKIITDQQAGSYLAAARMFMSNKMSSSKFGRWQLIVKAQSLMGSQGKYRGRGK